MRSMFEVRHFQHIIILLSWLCSLLQFLLVFLFYFIDFFWIVLSSCQIFLVVAIQLQSPIEVLFLLVLETLLNKMKAVCDDHYKCVSGMDLIQCIHQERIGGVIEYEQKHDCRFVLALCTVDQSNRAMFHLTCSQSLGMYVVQLFDFKSSLSGNGHGLSLSQQKDRLLMLQEFSKLSALLFVIIDYLCDIGRHFLQLFSNLLDQLDRGTILLLCHFSSKSNQVEHLMEEALRCSHASLSSDFDINGEIYFSGQSRALNIYNANRIYLLLVLQVVHYTYQILSLS